MIETSLTEREELMEAIYLQYGYDFRNYAESALKRRVEDIISRYDFESVKAMKDKIISDPKLFLEILNLFTITVTEFFRNPALYEEVIKKVFPYLKTYPLVKIWHAGCATGEEVYSLAILLKEAGFYDRCQIYATDINQNALAQAKSGIFPVSKIKQGSKNYFEAGGKFSLSQYLKAEGGKAVIDASLKEKIVFSDHNLVTDEAFGEIQLIFCRNVLIYFNRDLQNRVLNLFKSSLCPEGFLCLGNKENLYSTDVEKAFYCLSRSEKIYQKISDETKHE